jgi:hypothetical protein
MALNFPSSPTLYQQTTLANVTYVYNGTGWAPAGTSTGVSSVVTSVNGLTGNAVINTDLIEEGTNNKYFSATRIDQRLTAVSINLLQDVDTVSTTPTNGMSLVYKASSLRWEPMQLITGVSSVNTLTGNITLSLGNLSGVDLTTAPTQGQSLTYSSASGTWKPSTPNAALGGGNDQIFYVNNKTITANYTLPATVNAVSAGTITIADGITVTIADGAEWSIV